MNIWDACRNSDYDFLKYIIDEKGANVNEKDQNDTTGLTYGTVGKHPHIVKLLLERGANPNIESKMSPPLTIACMVGSPEIVRLLLDNNAFTKTKNKQGITAIHAAASAGYINCIEVLIEKYPELLDHYVQNSGTPLSIACEHAQPEVVKYLLEKGADPTIKRKDGKNPLVLACEKEPKESVKYLIEKGVDVHIKFGSDRMTALAIAASAGYVENVKLLLDAGANIDEEDIDGWTPLQLAAQGGHLSMLNFLLEHGADPKHETKQNCIPMISAAANGQLETTMALATIGESDIDHKTTEDRSALGYAIVAENYEIVKFLIERGANVNLPSSRDSSPLHLSATVEKGAKIIELLVKNGANMAALDSNKCTPLHYAALAKLKVNFVALLKLGAPTDVKNADDKTPFEEWPEQEKENLQALINSEEDLSQLKSCDRPECNNTETKPNTHKRCARCKIVYYCSPNCQKLDWKQHKQNCKKA